MIDNWSGYIPYAIDERSYNYGERKLIKTSVEKLTDYASCVKFKDITKKTPRPKEYILFTDRGRPGYQAKGGCWSQWVGKLKGDYQVIRKRFVKYL